MRFRPRALLVLGVTTACGDAGLDPNTGPSVVAVSPAARLTNADVDAPITIEFGEALAPLSGDPLFVFGRWSGPHSGTVSLDPSRTRLQFTPDAPFSAGEHVTVVLSAGSISNEQGKSNSGGYGWTFWVGSDAGVLVQTHVEDVPVRRAGEGLIRAYGAYAGDLNGDGYGDLVLPNEETNDLRILINDRAGGYGDLEVISIPSGARPSSNEGGDFDRDGFLDFAVGNSQGSLAAVYHGDGTGDLAHRQNLSAGQGVRGLCVADFDLDGYPDIVTASTGGNVAVFLNAGDGTLTSAGSFDAGNGESACATGDINGDGIFDIVIGARDSGDLAAFLGDGRGGFSPVWLDDARGGPWMLAAGDVNGDGHLDIVSANGSRNGVSVFAGTGDGEFVFNATYTDGALTIAVDLGDLDGDGDLDLVASHFDSSDWSIYENHGDGNFVLAGSLLAPSAGSCAILHDRDEDGDLDITGIDELDDLVMLFRNGS